MIVVAVWALLAALGVFLVFDAIVMEMLAPLLAGR